MSIYLLIKILEAIRASHRDDRVIIVAIDGAGGSGKSTLARKLQAADNQVSIV
ncbi:hypothetical protein [Nostoc sp.]|uniref:hypothetical protein n=1 Tax=Nostoc sp. TaxID=1180 RepID=UPI002FF446BC